MTTRDLLRALKHWWFVVLAALVGALALGYVFYQDGGGYVTKTAIVFSLPEAPGLTLNEGTTDESVIAFAGAVAAEVNDGKSPMRYATADAPYWGAGIRQGYSVALPNAGGQWVSSFRTATIEIQIVGRTYEWVETTQQRLVKEVLAVAAGQQAGGREGEAAITARVEPLTLQIAPIAPTRLGIIAALAALTVAALIAGTSVAISLERLLRSRRGKLEERTQSTRLGVVH